MSPLFIYLQILLCATPIVLVADDDITKAQANQIAVRNTVLAPAQDALCGIIVRIK